MTGTDGARCAAEFIERRFSEAGLPTRRQIFPIRLRDEPVEGKNVLARKRGTGTKTLVLLAHYDAPTTSRDAASDNATGVATLLELARIFSGERPERTILFVATDAGLWGSLGADRFVRDEAWRAFPGQPAAPPYAALSLDHLSPGTAAGIALRGGGQFEGFAPVWLRARTARAIAAAGTRVFPERPLAQIFARAVPITFHDQGPLVRRGVAAINLHAVSHREDRARRVVLTERDGPEKIRPGALQLFGNAAELAARAVITSGVTQSPDVITLTPFEVLPRDRLRWVAALLFLPLAVLAIDAWRRGGTGPRTVLRAASWALPALLAAAILRVATAFDLLPHFPLYPAAPRDPFLTRWAPLPMGAALAGALLGCLAAARLSRRPRREAGLALLLLAAAWAWVRNDVAAALFLGPAAWAWPWMGAAGGARRRWVDAALLLIGLAPVVALAVEAGERLLLGPWILWYGALLTAYGALGLHAVAVTGLALAAAVTLARGGRADPGAGG